MTDLARLPFRPAKWYTPTGANGRRITLVVLHSMEAPEKGDTAEAVARYFQKGSTKASAHYCVDADSIVQCVETSDVAYAAPGANHNGVHVEMAGYARQSAAEWDDAYSRRLLDTAAGLVRLLCKRFDIPVEYLDTAQVRNGERGITTHRVISDAFRRSTHTDPGPHFPMGPFLARVRGDAPQEDDVTDDDRKLLHNILDEVLKLRKSAANDSVFRRDAAEALGLDPSKYVG